MAKKGGWTDGQDAASPFAALAALKDTLPAVIPSSVPPSASPAASVDTAPAAPRQAVVRLERKGRGGKEVTLIQRLGLPPEALEAWALAARKALGCGGAVEDDAIVLQGDHRERAVAWLEKRGVAKISR
jgi:translation initiation factor 1